MARNVSYPKFVDVNSINSQENNNCRYWLEVPFISPKNSNKLCVILKNPSVANNNNKCDNTIRKVCNVAYNNGYSAVIILNLFPYRSTNPKGLLDFYGNTNYKKIMKRNMKVIQCKCNGNDVVFAWGTNTISKSKTNKNIYDTAIKDVTSRITNNTYYVKRCSCNKATCNNRNHSYIRYPLHGLRWHNNLKMIRY